MPDLLALLMLRMEMLLGMMMMVDTWRWLVLMLLEQIYDILRLSLCSTGVNWRQVLL
jgi:hypothetical protein